ncbi:MAG: proline--tRNA ligase, partial [Acidilobaceae archaeon]
EDKLISELKAIIEDIDSHLSRRAWQSMKSAIKRVRTLKELEEWAKYKRGIVEVPWCGKEECAHRVEETLEVKTLGTPWPEERAEGEYCPICGLKAVTWARYAKTY